MDEITQYYTINRIYSEKQNDFSRPNDHGAARHERLINLRLFIMGFRCLCLWGGAFTRILHFGVQTDTKTSLFNRGLVVYVYGTMLLIATRTSVYKQAQKQPFLNCLCLWGGASNYILYLGVQAGTKTNLSLVAYVYGMVL